METIINFLLIGLIGIAIAIVVLMCVIKVLLDQTEDK